MVKFPISTLTQAPLAAILQHHVYQALGFLKSGAARIGQSGVRPQGVDQKLSEGVQRWSTPISNIDPTKVLGFRVVKLNSQRRVNMKRGFQSTLVKHRLALSILFATTVFVLCGLVVLGRI